LKESMSGLRKTVLKKSNLHELKGVKLDKLGVLCYIRTA